MKFIKPCSSLLQRAGRQQTVKNIPKERAKAYLAAIGQTAEQVAQQRSMMRGDCDGDWTVAAVVEVDGQAKKIQVKRSEREVEDGTLAGTSSGGDALQN